MHATRQMSVTLPDARALLVPNGERCTTISVLACTVPHGRRHTMGYRVIGDRTVIPGVTRRGQSLAALVDDPDV